MYLLYEGAFKKIRDFYFRKILNYCNIKKGSTVLDYGCGPGDFLFLANKFGAKSLGVDSSNRSIRIAKARGLRVVTPKVFFRKNKYNYDLIILQSVIEHVSDPLELIEKLLKLLKPNGKIIISAPTPGPHFWDDPTHIRPFTPKSFSILAELFKPIIKLEKITYVFSFLLGICIVNSLFYKIFNIFPLSLGTNIVAIYKKND